MAVADLIKKLKGDPAFADQAVHWKTIPPAPAVYDEFPPRLDAGLAEALKTKGFEKLYSHQRTAYDLVTKGENIVVVTPTASGKTLCYNLPVLDAMAKDPKAAALYMFPTKALSRDQLVELHSLNDAMKGSVTASVYDGDTEGSIRSVIRESGDIIITNPYMLHGAILPNHTKWRQLFQRLRYVVLDELHYYRGVFGSHVSNVLRRLKRLAAHYGGNLQFIMSSATIGNPGELAKKMIGEPVTVIDVSGAPAGEKHFVLYNPPVVNFQMGLRNSVIEECRRIAPYFLRAGIQIIFFAHSRSAVEVLTKYLKDLARQINVSPELVVGYRGGYLPKLRRTIESGLRDGTIRAVVSTNALELGIDIGSLDSCVMAGYPGSLASTYQQSGRAGRRRDSSLSILVARNAPLDQYIMNNPDYLFARSEESVVVDPNHYLIASNHIKCAAFEKYFSQGEDFDNYPSTADTLDYFAHDAGILNKSGGKYFWMDRANPAQGVSLNSADIDNVVITEIDEDGRRLTTLGETDRPSSITTLYKGAIYGHQGDQYQVVEFDYENRRALVKKVEVDYYTDAESITHLRILHEDTVREHPKHTASYGEVNVNVQATIYKKIRYYTRENIGAEDIDLPDEQMDTTALWFTLGRELVTELKLMEGDRAKALVGVGNLFRYIAPLFIMCDAHDIRVKEEAATTDVDLPRIFVYDNYPGGVGLAEKAYELAPRILSVCRDVIENCPCRAGCPSCVGTPGQVGPSGKKLAVRILGIMLAPPLEPEG